MHEAVLGDRFSGIRFIGDVHGDAPAFAQAVSDARHKTLFVVQLGDLVDRGPDSPGCLKLGMDLTVTGYGVFILGNHDEKLRRALVPGNHVIVKTDLAKTLAAMAAEPDAVSFAAMVKSALDTAPLWLRYGRYFAVHGGFDPAMLQYAGPDTMPTRRLAKKHSNRALRGQAAEGDHAADEDDLPTRLYDWIDEVPDGLTVLIGHDAISYETVLERRGASGGRVLFCDTGCGKGGKLSWVDVPREELAG